MQIGRTIRCYTVEPLHEPVARPRPAEAAPRIEPMPAPEPAYVLVPPVPRDAA